jgi:hypothetical protein
MNSTNPSNSKNPTTQINAPNHLNDLNDLNHPNHLNHARQKTAQVGGFCHISLDNPWKIDLCNWLRTFPEVE